MIRFDVPFIFDRLGGPIGVLNHVKRHWPDAKLAYATVQMWRSRDAISQNWQAALVYLMKVEAGVDPLTCMVDDEDGLV